MVIPIGFEPMASRLGIWRSIRLSYGTTRDDYIKLSSHLILEGNFYLKSLFHSFQFLKRCYLMNEYTTYLHKIFVILQTL